MDKSAMMVNNSLFELLCEWRRWRNQYLKLVLILFGFAFSAALLVITLRLGGMLFFENPQWTKTDKPLYTVGRLYENNSLGAVNRQTLEKLKEFPMVEDVSWLVIKKYELTLENQQFNAINSAVFSSNMPKNIGLEIPQSSVLGIWLTHRFWQSSLNSDFSVIGKVFHFKHLPQGLPVLGVLDEKYDQVGTEFLDAWLSEEMLQHSAPFTGGVILDRFLLAAPMYYGIISATGKFESNQAVSQLAELDLTVKGMSFGKSSLPLTILPGVQLDPKSRQNMVFTWKLLLSLVFSLWLILIFTLFSLSSSRAILIADELRTLRLLGAQNLDFIISAARFAILMSVMVIVLIYPCVLFLSSLVQDSAGYQQYFGQQGIAFSVSVLLSALLIVILSLLTCACIPLVNLLKKDLFTRLVNKSTSLWQKLLSQVILLLQLTAALTAIYTLTYLVKNQWQQYQQTTVDLSALQINVDAGNFPLSWRRLLAQDKKSNNTAVLSSPFEQLHRYDISHPQTGQPINIATLHASSNFFNIIRAKVEGLEQARWQEGVVINHTLAKRLGVEGDGLSIIGSSINYGFPKQTYTIVGIVEDIPHWGRLQSIQPTLYLPLDSLGEDTLTTFSILKAASSTHIRKLTKWVESQAPHAKLSSPQPLSNTIRVFDQQSQDLLWFAFLVAVVIVGGVFSGLWYQLQAKLRIDKQTISVFLAIGASESYILMSRLKWSLISLIGSIILSLGIFSLLSSSSENQLQFDLFAASNALLITATLSCFAVIFPLQKLLKKPIQQSLRDL
ncbi:MAG: ABC transporter permease [Pseudomonadota bacterium]|nr:ABC transporter permease [Pseudomonadota bacterium]